MYVDKYSHDPICLCVGHVVIDRKRYDIVGDCLAVGQLLRRSAAVGFQMMARRAVIFPHMKIFLRERDRNGIAVEAVFVLVDYDWKVKPDWLLIRGRPRKG